MKSPFKKASETRFQAGGFPYIARPAEVFSTYEYGKQSRRWKLKPRGGEDTWLILSGDQAQKPIALVSVEDGEWDLMKLSGGSRTEGEYSGMATSGDDPLELISAEAHRLARKQNPGPLMTTMISSAVGGGAMQVGAVATSRLLNWATKGRKKGRKPNPEREDNPTGNLPAKAARQWEHVYESALDRGSDQAAAAQQAWCAVKRQYHKQGDRWLKRKKPLGRDESPPGCTPKAANPESPVNVRRLKSKLLR